MEWSEEGVVLTCRRHGESSVILELFTRARGRQLGLVRGGRSQRLRSTLQPGNSVSARWRARLEEHLGTLTVEPVKMRAAVLMDDPLRLAGLSSLTTMAQLVPERQAYMRLFDAFMIVLDSLEQSSHWPALLVRWEMGLLEELGFGLDLTACAGTGSTERLIYVSPKSGQAVSEDAGRPYAGKLFKLPAFLRGGQAEEPDSRDVLDGYSLTGHFLNRHVFDARGLEPPPARERLVALLRSQADSD